ncbi:gas vesicle protein [Salirhabdus euzebyi]|uniref:Gas vesicle protein n=1 Tax=Salirhabdus euzebyi TaxID=394506 RepID=A0A841Q1K1_9BACI|nr:YtxH domain-containing protein [Salirhabdus euzebyi]MBB6452143.1 gas vesicle protein [Salirhabdus euzebyi]
MGNEQNHNDNQNINSKDFLLGTLLGGIVGASVALLLAPKSGRELREDINHRAQNVRERAEDWKDIAYEKGSEWRDLAKNKTDEFSTTFTERMKDTKQQLQGKVNQLRDKMDGQDIADTLEEAADDLEEKFSK